MSAQAPFGLQLGVERSRADWAVRAMIAVHPRDARADACRKLHVHRKFENVRHPLSASDVNAIPVLHTSVHRAHDALSTRSSAPVDVNAILTSLAAELAPALPHLHAVADAHPGGRVASVLAHLRTAFARAATDRPDLATDAVTDARTASLTKNCHRRVPRPRR